mgnify:CR=1 FL=1
MKTKESEKWARLVYESQEGTRDLKKTLWQICSHGLKVRSRGIVIRSFDLDNSFSRISIRIFVLYNFLCRLEMWFIDFLHCNAKERIV